MLDNNLWIVFFSVVLILLIIVLAAVLIVVFGFSFCRCMCVKQLSCYCFAFDWEARQLERDALERLREIRRRRRQLAMNQPIVSLLSEAVPDSVVVYRMPVIRRPGAQFLFVPESKSGKIRDKLTAEQRRNILEQILVFHPYSERMAETEAKTTVRSKLVDIDLEANIVNIGEGPEEKSLEERGSEVAESTISPDCNESSEKAAAEDSQNYMVPAPIAIPCSKEPIHYENTCTICLDSFLEGVFINYATDCPHLFHKDCLLEWLDKHDVCPCCRRTMVTEQDWKRIVDEEDRVQSQLLEAVAAPVPTITITSN